MSDLLLFDEQPFLPTRMGGGNLQLWLDASDTSTITESGGSVSAWADKSGNGNNATQGTASAQPLTGVADMNGKNVIRFDGVNDALSVAASSTINNIWASGGTVIVVYRVNNVNGRALDKSGASGTAGWRLYWTDESAGEQDLLFQHDAATGEYGTITTAREISQTKPTINIATYSKATPSTFANFYIDSTTASSVGVFGSGSGAADDDSGSDLYIGNREDLARPMNGDVAEIIAYDRTLSSAEISLVYSYLANKWQGFALPSDLEGLVMWLDASDTDTITDSANAVSAWADKTGFNSDAIQGTASSQPITNVTTQNGKNVINWDGVNDAMSVASSTAIDDVFVGGATVFAVTKNITNNQRLWDKTTSSAAGHLALFTGLSGGFSLLRLEQGASTTDAKFTTATAVVPASVAAISLSYNSSNLTTLPVIQVNGSDVSVITAQTGVGTATTDASKAWFIGNRSDLARPLAASFAEFIVFDRTLTTDEKTLINNYLISKWGI